MFNFIGHYYPLFLDGTALTIIISIIGVILGIGIGLLIVLMRFSQIKLLQWVAKLYVGIVRGTPSMIQVMLVYYALSNLLPLPQITFFGSGLDRNIPGSIALGINSGAYAAEIFRSGIISVQQGQTEAGMSLGLSNQQTMFAIVLPQAIRNILPALGNEFITLIKESSVLFYIGVQEITAQALGVGGSLYDFVPPLALAALIYLVLTSIMSGIMYWLEQHMGNKYLRTAN